MAQVFPSQQGCQLLGIGADLLQTDDVSPRRLDDLGGLGQWLSPPRATIEHIVGHDPQAGLLRLRLIRIRTCHVRGRHETNHGDGKN